MIDVRTLGSVAVTLDGESPPRELMWRKNLALLLYLARSPDLRRTREHLVGVFWGDKPDASARHSLNEALRVIRKSAGDDVITSAGDQVVLSEGALRLDVDELTPLLDGEQWEEASALIRGPFMEGFAVPDSWAFEDWLAAERRTWLDRMSEGLRRYGEERLSSGDGLAARDAAARALDLDPFSDGAVRLAMLAAALRGERASALAIYDEYATKLAAELDLEPDPETEELAGRIRDEREWRLPGTSADPERWERRVPLVGREAELRACLELIGAAFARQFNAVILIEGDSGAGKTRLGEEIAARARLEGAAVQAIRCVPTDRERPGSTLAALSVPAAQRSLLWIDGAEHLDPESARALEELVRDATGTASVLMLTAASYPRREEVDDLSTRIGRDVRGVTLTLGALDTSGLRALADHLLPGLDEDAADRITRRIEADSAGSPLLATELLNAVRLGLELEEVGGVWPQPFSTMEQTYPSDLPDSVVAAIRIGYRRLSRPAQDLLAAAAVLDERCDAAGLSRAAAIEGEALDGGLDELEWNRWLVADERGYTFVARIVREVIARDMLTPGRRRRMRERMADD